MKIGKELLYLSFSDVESLDLSISECIDVLEAVYRSKSNGETEIPLKPRIGNPDTEGFLKAYSARIVDRREMGTKWLGARPANPKLFSLPTITGLIILNDPDTFCPMAVMDCTWITGMGAAGVSGIALRHLVREGNKNISVLGCGVQGRTHLDAAVSQCKGIDRIYAWGPHEDSLERFKKEMEERHGISITISTDAEYVVSRGDVLLSSTPFGRADTFTVVQKEWLKPGVTAISISGANHFEYDAFMSFDRYFMDDHEVYDKIQSRPRPWDGTRSLRPVMIGDLLTGRAQGRRDNDEKILLVTGGEGICDISVGNVVMKRALETGVGTILAR